MTLLPQPLFDSLAYIQRVPIQPDYLDQKYALDFQYALNFLRSYDGSQATFNAYRREVERLLQWSWLKAEKSIMALKRQDIEDYLGFCQAPPKQWIGIKKATRFMDQSNTRIPNPEWKPFVVTIAKSAYQKGERAQIENYTLSQSALRDIFSILSSFYNYLIQEDVTDINPIATIRQKSKFLRQQQVKQKIRRLTKKQWQYVIETAEKMAERQADHHERTLFIMSALFAMYLRISELAAHTRWTPTMNDFWQDYDGHWWFVTIGKGNKERQITVSHAMLSALKRWRQHLNISPLPSPADNTPLLPKHRGKGAIRSTTYIREIVQDCFNKAGERLRSDNFKLEADNLEEATVHWLRHTGISEDVKIRPREHVRDDAGHSSGAITDKYIDIELKERHASGVDKPIQLDDQLENT